MQFLVVLQNFWLCVHYKGDSFGYRCGCQCHGQTCYITKCMPRTFHNIQQTISYLNRRKNKWSVHYQFLDTNCMWFLYWGACFYCLYIIYRGLPTVHYFCACWFFCYHRPVQFHSFFYFLKQFILCDGLRKIIQRAIIVMPTRTSYRTLSTLLLKCLNFKIYRAFISRPISAHEATVYWRMVWNSGSLWSSQEGFIQKMYYISKIFSVKEWILFM